MTLVIEFGTAMASKKTPDEVKSATKVSLFQIFEERSGGLRALVFTVSVWCDECKFKTK
jgi:hypothetical protein